MKKNIFIILLLFIIISISVFVFIKSPLFLNAVTGYINSHTDLNVRIGSIYFEQNRGLVIRNFLIEEKKLDGSRLEMQYAQIRASLKGILRKNIEEIILVKPKLSITYKKDGKSRISMPFTFNRISVSGADVMLRFEKDRSLHISEISISLDRPSDEKNAILTGNAFIRGPDSRISLSAEVDTQQFDLIKGRIDVSPTDLTNLSAQYSLLFLKNTEIKGLGRLSIEMERKEVSGGNSIRYQASASFQGLHIRSDSLAVDLEDKTLELVSQGAYYKKQDQLEVEFFSARLSQLDLFELRGTIKNISSQTPDIIMTADSRNIPIYDIKKTISGSEIKWLDQTDIDGFTDAKLVISGKPRSPGVKGELSFRGEKFAWKNLYLRSVKARLPVEYKKGFFSVRNGFLQASESVYLDLSDKKHTGYKLQNTKLLIPSFIYNGSTLKADNFQIHADIAAFVDNESRLEEKNISIKGNVEGDISPPRFKINNLLLKTDLIKGVSGNISILPGKRTVIDAALFYTDIDIEQMSKKLLIDILRKHEVTVTGTGELRTVITATFSENAKPQISGTNHLTLASAGFSSGDESIIGEGIEMKVSNSFEFSLPLGQLNFKFDSEAANFELLAGKFYDSFKDRVLSFSAKGKYTKENDSLQITESKLALTHIGNIFMSGTVSKVTESPLIDANIKITDLVNSETFNLFIRNTFQEQFPLLSSFEVDGESSAELHIRGKSGRFTARGYFQTADMNISNKSFDKTITGISLTLPVAIEYPESSQTHGTVQFGSLRVKDAVWSGIKLKDIEVDPSVWGNDVIFRKDIAVPVLGGDIIFRNISYNNIFSPERQLGFSVDIKNIDLEQASVAFSLPEFNGKLSGNIPRARLYQNNLLADGEINMDLFGGSMKISNLSVDNVFSSVASLKTNIEFNEIDLSQLTNTFDFGHISGLVRGKIDDLVIVNGQAQSFSAFLESYKKKGVSQTINVAALKKISILGSGSSPSVLDRGVYQFFREYKYDKLGFRASLENDNLLLLGIETEGNKGYLVKSGLLPPKVDVINYIQNISFKEMVSRLKRIKQLQQ